MSSLPRCLLLVGDVQVQLELAHRDFIVLCQFCLSYSIPFARLARSFFIRYFQLFPPIFFREKVLETLCFTISKLTSKLNLNYSNISDIIKFPHFDLSVVNVAGKTNLNQILNLFLSVVLNLYFTCFFFSRYLTKSMTENFLRAISQGSSDEKLGKLFLAYVSQIEPEVEGKLPDENLFLVWLRSPAKFQGKLNFLTSRLD